MEIGGAKSRVNRDLIHLEIEYPAVQNIAFHLDAFSSNSLLLLAHIYYTKKYIFDIPV